jgi:hypothetical protein
MIRRRHGAVQPLGYYLRAGDPRATSNPESVGAAAD